MLRCTQHDSEGVQGDRMTTAGSTWRALDNRNFALFFAGQGLSLCGTWMQSLAQSWLIYRLTALPCCWVSSDLSHRCRCWDSSSRRRACGPLVTSPSPLDHSDSLPPSGDDPRRTHAERAHHDRLDHGARGSLGSHQRARYAVASILHCRPGATSRSAISHRPQLLGL